MSFFKKKTEFNEFEYQQIINSISFICIQLNYSLDVKNKAIEIVKDAVKKKIHSSNPAENAAAAVYISRIIIDSPTIKEEFEDEFDSKLANNIIKTTGITKAAFKQYYIKYAETVDIDIILASK